MAVTNPHLLIVGCGDIGTRVGRGLSARGWHISALRRQPENLPGMFQAFAGDYTTDGGLASLVDVKPDYLLFTPTPASRDEQGYRRGFSGAMSSIAEIGAAESLRGGVLVSSTRVFAETSGNWVDETSALATNDPFASSIIEAEKIFLALISRATVFRASGLYDGSPQGHLVSRIAQGLFSQAGDRYSNRIHRDDIATAIEFAFLQAEAKNPLDGIFVASDDLPARMSDVERWLAEQIGVPYAASAAESHGGERGNRRCDNSRLKAAGFTFRYPDYRAGYGGLKASKSS